MSDFWNGEKYSSELKRQRKFGFNMVMCNTQKGEELFKEIEGMLECRKMPASSAIEGDVRLRHAEKEPSFRNEAYSIVKEKGYAYLAETYSYKPSFIQRLLPTFVKNLIREIQSLI